MFLCVGWMFLATNNFSVMILVLFINVLHHCSISYIVIYIFFYNPLIINHCCAGYKNGKNLLSKPAVMRWDWSESAPYLEQPSLSLGGNGWMERFVGVLQLTTHMPWKHEVASTSWTNNFYPFDKCTTNALVLKSVASQRLLCSLLSTYLWAVKAGYPYYFCWALSIYFCKLSSAADYDGKQNDHWLLHTDEAKFRWACLMKIREYTWTDVLSAIYMLSMLKKMNDGLRRLTRAISQSFFSITFCTNITITFCWFIYQKCASLRMLLRHMHV